MRLLLVLNEKLFSDLLIWNDESRSQSREGQDGVDELHLDGIDLDDGGRIEDGMRKLSERRSPKNELRLYDER